MSLSKLAKYISDAFLGIIAEVIYSLVITYASFLICLALSRKI